MTADELLEEVSRRGILLRIDGDDLTVIAPREVCDTSLLDQLRANKTTILNLINTGAHSACNLPITITPQMLSLVDLTQEEIGRIVDSVPGGAGNVQDIYPLAPLQEGILFHHLMGSEGDPYLLASLLSFDTRVRLDGYLKALQAVVDRHDILRTAVNWEGLAQPVQVVWRKAPLHIEEVRLDPAAEDAAGQLYARLDPRLHRIDVRQAPLLRIYLAYDTVNDRWVMMQLLHHLAGDHTTLEVLQTEVQEHLLGRADRLSAPLPFRNLVARARLGISQEEHETFFRAMLGDVDEPTAPFGLLDVQGDGTDIEEAHLTLENDLARRLRSNARRLGVSTATLCHLAWALVLARISGRQDVVFGTVLFGRMQGGAGADRVMGLFINTLPVRIAIGEESVEASVRRTHALLAGLLRHEHAPLALAQRCSSVPAPAPLFSALLNYRHSPVPVSPASETIQAWEGIAMLHMEERTNYPVTLSVNDLGQGLSLDAQTPASVGPLRVCEFMRAALQSLADALETAPSTALRTLDVLPASERHRVLYEWNDTKTEFPGDKCVHQLFEEQVLRTPDAVAVVFEDDQLSYAELNRRANQLAHYLRQLGVNPDDRVAICVERSLEMVIALLAVLKAGGAYVPLDPAYPPDRLGFMLEDSAPVALLTQTHLADLFNDLNQGLPLLHLDQPSAPWLNCPDSDIDPHTFALNPEHLAYVIYTSGSTGIPKGVLIKHENVIRLFSATYAWFRFDANDVWTLFHSYAFDFSVWEIWGALFHGGRLIIIPKDLVRSPDHFYALICRERITVLNQTPSAFRQLIVAQKRSRESHHLRHVIFGGEPLKLDDLRPWYEQNQDRQTQLVNMYGITETTVHVTYRRVQPVDTEIKATDLIGCPIPDLQIYILDKYGEPVPVGVAGELYIGGAGVARGYLNRPELTAERFLADPFTDQAGARMYRTGDLGRWLPDGNIEFLGRNDFQVKIRGFRIELGEIEARLMEHGAVREAVVIAREDSSGDKRLIAYYTATDADRQDEETLTAQMLRSHLAAALPEYMLPAAYVRLQSLPLTPNGKLDRKALPAPETDAYATHRYEPPQGEIETALAAIWEDVLRIDRVGRHDNFFELGGDSIRTIAVISQAKALGLAVTVDQLFKYQTIQDLAKTLPFSALSSALQDHALRAPVITKEDQYLVPHDIEDAYVLTRLQTGMIFHNQLTPELGTYHDVFSYRIRILNWKIELFQSILDEIAQKHPILRTSFSLHGFSEPLQLVHRSTTVPVSFLDISSLNQNTQETVLTDWIQRERVAPFDLTKPPLLRIAIHRYDRDTYQYTISFHHAILDGWSFASFQTELFREYDLQISGKSAAAIKPPASTFKMAVAREREALGSESTRLFWQEFLRGIPSTSLPPFRPGEECGIARNFEFPVSSTLKDALTSIASALRVPLRTVLLTAYLRFLSLISGEMDVVTGIVSHIRPEELDGENALGLFLNTLPFRQTLHSGSWSDLISAAFNTELNLIPHRCYPYSQMFLNNDRIPLFDTLFNYTNFHVYDELREITSVEFLSGTAVEVTNFSLTLNVSHRGDVLTLSLAFDPARFSHHQIKDFAGYYLSCLQLIAARSGSDHTRSSILPASERHRVLYEWNDTKTEFPGDKCVHQLFEEQVLRTPDAVAVVFEDDQLSYAELNRRANQLAHYLRQLGVNPDDRVAICVERSLEMVIALLAVLKAGGAYVPLDPAYPPDRLGFMLEDSAPVALLTQTHLADLFNDLNQGLPLLHLDQPSAPWLNCPDSDIDPHTFALNPEHLAYVIYTSGSTGIPKGAMGLHKAITNRFAWMHARYPFETGEVCCARASFSFVDSVWELLGPLTKGVPVIVLRAALSYNLSDLALLLAQHRVTRLVLVPSLLRALLHSCVSGEFSVPQLKYWVTSGEALPRSLAVEFHRSVTTGTLLNLYGSSEDGADVACYEVESHSDTSSVPIGRPIANTRVYILDKYGEPVPVGVAGELYIGGAGVARGYLNRPELTAERFLADPFTDQAGARMYRTGDLGRWLPDGNIEFLGRNDFQVKIRGFRIELGEIEARLMEHGAVREAVVIAREDSSGDKRLIAYYTATDADRQDEETLTAQMLRSHLAAALPEYMLPAAYVRLQSLPLTPNGKLDRKALPAPETDAYATHRYEPPQGEIETALAAIWEDVLRIDRVGRHDNFFELGGHSLLAVRVIARLRQTLNLEVAIADLFAQPVLADLAGSLENAVHAELPPIAPAERSELLSLSFAQQRLWFLAQMPGVSEAYHIPFGLTLKGELDREALRRALDRIVVRHEALRTVFAFIDEQPVQQIIAPQDSRFLLIEHDLRQHNDIRLELGQLIALEAGAPFDLQHGPLIRGRLIRLSDNEHSLLITMHHIVSDGWSMGILINELSALYTAFLHGDADPLPELQLQYADYAVWQRKWIEGDILSKQADYWKTNLADAPVLLELPADHPRPAQQDYAGAFAELLFDEQITTGLKNLSRRHGSTLYMTLLTAWAALLARLSGQQDVIIGSPVANRGRAEIENLIGFFVNTLALRIDLSGTPTVSQLLERVKTQAIAAQQHQDIPFEQVVELAQPVRSLAHSPLFQVMFVWQNTPPGSLLLPGLELMSLPATPHIVAKFDLSLVLMEANGCIAGGIEYATALFEPATIRRYIGYFRTLLQAMVADGTQTVDRLPILTASERHRVLYEWNDTKTEFPGDKCVHQLFEEQVLRTPDAVAVVFEDDQLSYAELNRRANQLAHYLRQLGVNPDDRVAICVERSLEMVIALLAVLKAGGAYVPLDPAYPPDRLGFMLEDSAPVALLTQTHLADLFNDLNQGLPLLHLDQPSAPWLNCPDSDIDPHTFALNPEHLAYVIYTSGSTGIPKGAMGLHKAITNRFAWMHARYPFETGEVCCARASFSFLDSVWELLGPLTKGVPVIVLRAALSYNLSDLALLLAQHRVTRLVLVPSLLRALLHSCVSGEFSVPQLKYWVTSGEALPRSLAVEFHRSVTTGTLLNLYGSSEDGADVACYEVESHSDTSSVPIGRPIANTRVYILDKYGEPVPVGVAGELYIAGVQVARGYLNRPELTAERFLADPFTDQAGARMYRTGDLGRWLPDGNIEFLGRNDFQVKIRGFRIELGEIEARLMEHGAVREAVVIAREDSSGDKRLIAYYTATDADRQDEETLTAQMLRSHLAAALPEYMLPAAYVRLQSLPLTPNGKLDRKALPAPETDAYATHRYEPPQGEIETALAAIWEDVLRIDRVGRHDNFFELGGHSLLAVRVIARLRQTLNLEVAIADLFAQPVLADLAGSLENAVHAELPPIARLERTKQSSSLLRHIPADKA